MIDLRYFRDDEFRGWFADCSVRLLVLLDSFRHQWGRPVTISPVNGAIGRRMNRAETQHNIERWGEVRALDIFAEGLTTRGDMERAVGLAMRTGFTGIGVYPDWQPHPGLHLDVRTSEAPGDPALWGGLDDGEGQYYVGYETALERMR